MKLTLYLAMGAFLILNIVFIIFRSKAPEEEDTIRFGRKSSLPDFRKKQVVGFRENSLKRKYEETVELKADSKKMYETQEMLMQAGLDWSYGELRIVEWLTAIFVSILIQAAMNNLLMSFVFFFIGKFFPKQIVNFIANKRVEQMDSQVGSFIQLVTERYKAHGDFQLAIRQSAPDFKSREPMYSEIQKTILDLEIGTPTSEAMEHLAKRTGNQYLKRLADYYEIAATLGTKDARERIVGQAFEQYNENFKMKQKLKTEIAGPKNEAFLMLAFIPCVIVYECFVDDNYITYMTTTGMGKFGSVAIVVIFLFCFWFINKKIGAPLD